MRDTRAKLVMLAGAAIGVAFAILAWPALKKPIPTSFAVALSVSANKIIGYRPVFLGDNNAPFTLVEFADYQCSPCKSANAQISAVLSRYRGRLRFVFRNYPLSVHAQAMPAAAAAEAARQQGKFWPMHDALYEHQQTLDARQIETLINSLDLNPKQMAHDSEGVALHIIAEDRKVADSFHLVATPTFVLCCANQQVYYISSLDQISRYIR